MLATCKQATRTQIQKWSSNQAGSFAVARCVKSQLNNGRGVFAVSMTSCDRGMLCMLCYNTLQADAEVREEEETARTAQNCS